METMWILLIHLVLLHTVSASVVNVAFGKPALMSSKQPGYTASEAVDGNTNAGTWGANIIIDTGPGHPFAWWKVDLETEVQDATVKIYFRTDYKWRRNGMKLYTSTSPFSSYPGPDDQLCDTVSGKSDGSDIPDVYSVPCPGRWRYLLLYTDTDNKNNGQSTGPTLDFGEVEVLFAESCSDGLYGDACTKSCNSRHCLTMPTTCDKDGKCPNGCQNGWTGLDCTACSDGLYGDACTKPCNSRHCLTMPTTCDKDGTCPGGCQNGWTGLDCTACSVGHYGDACTKPCNSRHCLTMPTTCDKDGTCPGGCQNGWTGLDCTACSVGHYGDACTKPCNSRHCLTMPTTCDKDGTCPGGCQNGWTGLDCTACSVGHYGDACTKPCNSRHCLTMPTTCDKDGTCPGGCQNGWTGLDCTVLPPCPDSNNYGLDCDKLCSERNCKASSTSSCYRLTGRCPDGCVAGWRKENCTQACDPGSYGASCASTCSTRHCLSNTSSCDHVTGQCDGGCQPGYKEPDCVDDCDSGSYGSDCSSLCSDRKCRDSTNECDQVTGQCRETSGQYRCTAGYKGLDCITECDPGYYGSGCNQSCADRYCSVSSSECDHVTGQCVDGCEAGYNGTDCREECGQGNYGVNCALACTDRHCTPSSSVCGTETGQCIGGCEAGYTGVDCTSLCKEGSYGLNCTEKCGECDGVCDSVDGRCPAGCLNGYNGTKCDVPPPEGRTGEPTDIIVPAAAGAAAALVVILVIIVVVVLCRRKRSKQPKNDENQKLENPLYNTTADSSIKKREISTDNVYVNVALEHEDLKDEKPAVVPNKTKPLTAPKPSRDNKDDQSEEILDEDEAPTSTQYYNIDEDDVIREVAVEDLAATVQRIRSRKGGFEAEYNRLPTGFTATYADSQKEENAGKNKFRGYYPYDNNRVRLSLLPDVPGSDYINASIMHNIDETKTYIGAQAPKKITLGDFWRMIWEQGCGRVVMLTGLVEDAKPKCYKYWPENDLLTTDHYRVTLEETNTRANYTIRTMKVEKIETGESRRVVQYHYTTWPDHGVPDTLALVNFIWMMRRTHTRTDGPLLVHCSAGIGRTGTYIAVDSLLDQAREEGKVDVQGYVSMMRGQRKNMIQTTAQYECVFNCLVEMTKYGNTSLTVDDFTTLYTNSGMDARVDSDGKTFGELTRMMLVENNSGAPVKNRLWVDGNEEFIVRTAPSLRGMRGHLLCESPHSGQEKLLWKLVEENNVNNVIVLDKTQHDLVDGKKGSTKTFNDIQLTTEDQTKLTSDLSLSKLLIQIPVHNSKRNLQLLQFNDTVSVESLSASFLEHSHLKLMTSELASRTVVHRSIDRKVGVMFCVLGNLMSEIQEDETVDVLHQVRSFTRIFPDIRLTKDDVKQLFDFARRCAQLTASTYANM